MPGTVLLLAASPVGKGCLVDAASVLPVLAAVPPAVLAGTDTANVVELADPLEPQAVLTRLRAAAGTPGPLTIFVAGQVQLDRRQRLPHLALARTTASTVRYTALPWHWLREELRLRAAGTTTVVLDLRADAETWEWLRGDEGAAGGGLGCGVGVALYGRVASAGSSRGRRGVASPSYMKAVATILRSGGRPGLEQLHQMALARIGGEGEVGDLVFSAPAAPTHSHPHPHPLEAAAPGPPQSALGPETGGDPHSAIAAAVQAGRHDEADAIAARWEGAAVGGSEEALHWAEVRADLAMFAGDAARSCRTWMAVAVARLAAGQPVDAPAVEAAVDRAHHQWGRIGSADRARELGPALVELRGRVPGRRDGALDHVRQQLQTLG
ncbi:hypothetical protein SAMN04487983_107317 [Streptomyces sp. yr375]|uniref:hypothetical protein n=1 Tax=Streptomyces sp. yr375 TaxID=1761906 RepID=UPI0008D3DAF9|nr:hypothetical protein [Streptomyces sp. yr375]SES48917.1 hypothetical protein SAMN04487983_107317 [Streptomyces sp. yr375]